MPRARALPAAAGLRLHSAAADGRGAAVMRVLLLLTPPAQVIDMDGMKALTTEAMCQEYMAAKRKELQAAVKFNLAVDHIFEQVRLQHLAASQQWRVGGF